MLAKPLGLPVHILEDFSELLFTRDYTENVLPKLTIRLKELEALEKEWDCKLIIEESPRFYPTFPEVEEECFDRIKKACHSWVPDWPE
jgi:hypothetical protein